MAAPAPANSLKEYLKRYQSDSTGGGDPSKKTKKKKKKPNHDPKPVSGGILVVDEDPVWQKPVNPYEEEEEDCPAEDKPVVDEDIEVKRMKRLEAIRSKKPYHAISEDGSGWVSVSNLNNHAEPPNQANDGDLSPPRLRRARYDTPSPDRETKESLESHRGMNHSPRHRTRGTSEVDLSPPRANLSTKLQDTSKDPDLSLPRRKPDVSLDDISPPRKPYNLPTNHARPGISTVVSDLSPPRRRRRDSSDDLSPPRRRDSPDDLSPPRRRDSPDDLSPPRRKSMVLSDRNPSQRRKQQDAPHGVSPLKRRRMDTPDGSSPPKRRDGDSPDDLSPPRRRRKHTPANLSPPGRKHKHAPDDLSPPRRRRKDTPDDLSPARRQRETTNDLSPPRRNNKESDVDRRNHLGLVESKNQHRFKDRDLSPPRKTRKDSLPTKEAPRAGLFSANEIKEELEKKRKDELSRFASMDPLVSGRGAEPVFRDKEGKRISKEELAKSTEDEKPKEQKLEWGKGLAQKREAEGKALDLELEKEKPFARSRDDPELDKVLKERIRWGDPMAHLVKRKNSEPILEDLGADEKMKESGFIIPQTIPNHSWIKRVLDFPPNRYGIRPGRHWDGVDRSNGYEKELFKRQNEKRATETEAYLWSVSDM